MKICVAQTKPIAGDIQSNIDGHKKLLDLIIAYGADIIIFPELSLTGYEPKLSKKLATNQNDYRLDDFQIIADAKQVTIGVGIPIRDNENVYIGMVIFQPYKTRQTYSKQYLHSDEEEFFVRGQNFIGLMGNKANIALAICYELSVPEHSEQAFSSGAEIYIASVAKSASGVDQATKRLSEIATKYSMTVFMSNCLGPSDDFESIGKTAVWNEKGLLLAQLNDANEGFIIFDTDSKELIEKMI